MYSIGFDIGSSSIKGAVVDIETGIVAASGFSPKNEMEIISVKPGFAEQNPETWWENIKLLSYKLIKENKIEPALVKCVGISYQMHGLVMVDKNNYLLHNSIIWCDSRAVDIGNKACEDLGADYCLGRLLNSPGNFTASKLKWIKENDKTLYKKIGKILLPGDYIALKLTGLPVTTMSGLTEGIFWDFPGNKISDKLLNYYGIEPSLLADVKPTFAVQGVLSKSAAHELGLPKGIPVSYRAGDQPNNAFSLNVLNPGEVAATAGTSGVMYSVAGDFIHDEFSRVNSFAHVNYSNKEKRLGVLLCINGTGILNSWVRKYLAEKCTYDQMNQIADLADIGSKGISILPFGNGAERMLKNRNIGSHILGLDFNRHSIAHIFRGAQEGVAFSFKYGFDIMREMGVTANVIRAAHQNMFLSNVFAQTLSDITGLKIELYNTDGAQGAARGAAYGAGFYKSVQEAFENLRIIDEITPIEENRERTSEAFNLWLNRLNKFL
jgi:xylulokinase